MGAARNAINRRTAGARNPYGASERRPRRRAGWRTAGAGRGGGVVDRGPLPGGAGGRPPGWVRGGVVVVIGPLPGRAVVGAGPRVAGTRGSRAPATVLTW